MSCKKSLDYAIKIGHMIDHGYEPKFMFSSLESYKTYPPVDNCDEDDVAVYSVRLNQDGTQVVAGSMNSTIRIFNIVQSNKKNVVTMKPSKYILGMPITCMRYVPRSSDKLVACSPCGHIYMCYPSREGFETLITEDNETYALDISHDGMEIATCGRDRNIRLYRFSNAGICEDSRMGNFIRKFWPSAVDEDMRELGHGMTIHAVKFHPDNACLLVSAGWDNIVKMWDTRTNVNPVWKISGPHVCSPDGIDIKNMELFTASWKVKDALQIWDLRVPTLTTIPIVSIPLVGYGWNCENGDTEYLYGVRIGDNNAIVTCGSGFSGIRVVNRENQRPIGESYLGSCVNSLDIVFGGRQIVTGCSKGNVVLSRMK